MVKVLLRRNWFAPGGRRYKESIPKNQPVDIPDDLVGYLPPDAKIVDDSYEVPVKVEEPMTLSEAARMNGADLERINAEALDEMMKQVLPAPPPPTPMPEKPKRGPGRPKKG